MENRRASRRWWDADADAYQAEHGDFLGDVDLMWCPEGLREAEAHLLGDVRGPNAFALGRDGRALLQTARPQPSRQRVEMVLEWARELSARVPVRTPPPRPLR